MKRRSSRPSRAATGSPISQQEMSFWKAGVRRSIAMITREKGVVTALAKVVLEADTRQAKVCRKRIAGLRNYNGGFLYWKKSEK